MIAIDFDKGDGLVPCVVQDENKNVLMLAYMNRESLQKTVDTGLATYWSRSRDELWTKGETSGHYQHVKDIRVDCDADTLLITVIQEGAACHTGHYSCFYRNLEGEKIDE
jgi:phosphoribosyl-AMP cyclohydrolase